MKKHILLAGMAATIGLASCTSDELGLTTPQTEANAIGYSVMVPSVSRAVDSYCNANTPQQFKVWGIMDANTVDAYAYVPGDVVEKTSSNPDTWASQAGQRYWPDATKPLNFYATVNGDRYFNYMGDGATTQGTPKFTDFDVQADVAQQLDLMYAVQTGQTRDNAQVNLNFRHALSQVCFRAVNRNSFIRVIVKGIRVVGLRHKGTYTLPTASTTENYTSDHSDADGDQSFAYNHGAWDLEADTTSYEIPVADLRLPSTVTNISCPGDGHGNGWEKVMTLMPQQAAKWDPTQTNAQGKFEGAAFLVKCEIYNERGDGQIDAKHDKLYGDEYQYAAIPVDIDWQEGKRYIYTFNFGEGMNAGYTPDPSNPKPVLNTISYTVTVDDFIPANQSETDMNDTDVLIQSDVKHKFTLMYGADTAFTRSFYAESINLKLPTATNADPEQELSGFATTQGGTLAYHAGDDVTITWDKANNPNDTETTLQLYPIWVAKQQHPYSVTVKGDAAPLWQTSSSASSVNVSWANLTAGGLAVPTVNANAEPNKEYNFEGWIVTRAAAPAASGVKGRRNADAAEEILKPNNGLTIDGSKPVVTLEEKWVEKQKHTFTVTFNENCAGKTVSYENAKGYDAATAPKGDWTTLTYTGYEETHTFTLPLRANGGNPEVAGGYTLLGLDTNGGKVAASYADCQYYGDQVGDDGTPVAGRTTITVNAGQSVTLYMMWQFNGTQGGGGNNTDAGDAGDN